MPGSDWVCFFERLKQAGGDLPWGGGRPKPHPRRLPLVHPRNPAYKVGAFYGSSLNFDAELREYRPDLLVPAGRVVPLFKAGLNDDWSGPPPEPGTACPNCGGRIGPPPDGSGEEPTAFYCPRCQASGYDDRLAVQRLMAGLPPAERPEGQPGGRGGTGRPARRPTRRERRAARFAAAEGTPAAAPVDTPEPAATAATEAA